MNSKFKQENAKFLFLLLVALAIRFINIGMPILEGTATRQVQTAMVARNLYKHSFNIFYPEVDHYGPGETYLFLEFPLLNFLAALGYRALGGVNEWVGRFLSILFFMGGLIFLYLLVRKIFNSRIAFWAGFVFSFSPLSIIFSRAFMPDFEMLFFALGSIYFAYLYSENKGIRYLWLSAIFAMLALLVKPHSFYVFILLGYLLFKKSGWRAFLDYKNYLFFLIAFLPAFLWYTRAGELQAEFLPYESYNFNLLHWMKLDEFLSWKLYRDLLNIYSGIFLTPVGFALLILGLFIRSKKKENIIWVWTAGIFIYLIVFVSHIDEPYYNLVLLPLVSIFIARAIVFLKDLPWREKTFLSNKFARLIFLLFLALPLFRYGLYAYIVPRGYRYIPEAAEAVKRISKQSDLIIASSYGGPAGLYFCDRKGWTFPMPGSSKIRTEENIRRLEELRSKGAKYFLVCVVEDFQNSPYFKEYMERNYKIVAQEKGKYILFKL